MSSQNGEPMQIVVSIWFTSKVKDNEEHRLVNNLSKTENVLSMLKSLPNVSHAYLEQISNDLHIFKGDHKVKIVCLLELIPDFGSEQPHQ